MVVRTYTEYIEYWGVAVEYCIYYNSNDDMEVEILSWQSDEGNTHQDFGYENEDAWERELENCIMEILNEEK